MKATHQSSVVALTLAALLTSAAQGGTATYDEPLDRPVDALERLYRVCERASTNGTLSPDGVAYCSKVYEELTSRAFGGSVEQLTAWAKAQQSLQTAGRH